MDAGTVMLDWLITKKEGVYKDAFITQDAAFFNEHDYRTKKACEKMHSSYRLLLSLMSTIIELVQFCGLGNVLFD